MRRTVSVDLVRRLRHGHKGWHRHISWHRHDGRGRLQRMSTQSESALSVDRLFELDEFVRIDDRTLAILEQRRRTAVVRRRGWLVRRLLLLADVTSLALSFGIVGLAFGLGLTVFGALGFLVGLILCWIVLAKVYGLYDRDEERTDYGTLDDIPGLFHLLTVGAWIVLVVSWLVSEVRPEVPRVFAFWAIGLVLLTVARSIARYSSRKSIAYLQNTLVVGAGEVGQLVAHKLLQHPEYGINLVGFIDADPPASRREDVSHVPILGPPDRLAHFVRLFDIERVVVAFSNDSHKDTLDQIRSLPDYDVQVDIVPRLFEAVGPNVGMHSVEGVPLIGLPPTRLSRSSILIKRSIDIVGAVVGLTLFSPLLLYAAIRIKRESPGPVFFRQVRMGADEKTFRIFKFRTMVADADQRKEEIAHLNIYEKVGDTRMFKVPDDPRVTKFGGFLRRYSLDELPQLLNVLTGEMSLVGPRPLILEEDVHVSEWARRRLKLKPGLTGLWQVLGRNDIPFEEMTKLDYLYVTGWTLWGDLRLIIRTIPAIMRPRRVY